MSAIPTRIQRKRVKGWRKPAGAVDCTRHKGGKWGNDYRIKKLHENLYAVYNKKTGYRADFGNKIDAAKNAVYRFESIDLPFMDVSELAGKTLMCWCKEGDPCHVDPILRKANPC